MVGHHCPSNPQSLGKGAHGRKRPSLTPRGDTSPPTFKREGGGSLKEGPRLEGGWLLLYLCFLLSLLTRPGLLTQSLLTEEFQALVKRLPGDRFLNRTAISHFWAMDLDVQHRYQQLGTSLKLLARKTHRIIRRLFNLSKRCHRQPRFKLPKER